jgi:hypothetical protein
MIRAVSCWVPGKPRQFLEGDLDDGAPGVLWFDINPAVANLHDLWAALASRCEGLQEQMIVDLLTPDEEPIGKSYGDGGVRIASSFSVKDLHCAPKRRARPEELGRLEFHPVELLAADNWLITCAHPARVFRGAQEVPCETLDAHDTNIPDLSAEVLEEVSKRWASGVGRNAGDLGTLILHELALSYAPAHRALARWLEDWELGLHLDEEIDRNSLAHLWGSMAILRDWLNLLNRVGLRAHPDRAWLCGTDHEEVVRVDDHIDHALKSLGELGATLRATFGLLQGHEAEQDRGRREDLQRRLELIAVGFLVPTLIVGFYGANTWVPGQSQIWGFWVMVAALIIFSLITLGVVQYWHKQQRLQAGRAAADRAELRRQLQGEGLAQYAPRS